MSASDHDAPSRDAPPRSRLTGAPPGSMAPQAMDLQPRDPKGQDLLAVVYFRIGLYPHAIQIYEELLRENPRDHSLRLNLALCCLKTGQAQAAREQLEVVVHNNPAHKRAWGYLGLAFERLGDIG